MKKITLLLLTLCFGAISYAQTPVLTAIVDGDCSGGTPKLLEIYADGTVDFSLYSIENQTNANTSWGATQSLADLGTVTDDFVYITTSGSSDSMISEFPSVTSSQTLVSNTINLNGDDRIRIILTSDSSVVDQYGETDVDGTGKSWEYKDSYAKRVEGTSADSGFAEANWVYAGAGSLDGLGVCQGGTDTYEVLIGGVGTYTTTTTTTPEISITAPTDGATLASTTTSVTVSVSTTDFAVGATDAGLDGHIHWSIQENSDAAVDQAMKYDTNDETISVTSGNTYTVFMELRDNSHQPLSPEVNTSVTFSVEAGSNTVTPLTSATWKGYINTFNISDGAYQFGFEYGVADMQSTITDTYVKLQPNFGIWTAEASNAAWFDSSSGTQTPILNIEGNTFVENNDLAGSDLTFEGNVSAADLDAGYTAVAFIKALDPNNGYATVVNKSIDITSAGDFTVSATAAELVEGFIVQYGFAVTGPPADPATEDSLGSVVMGVEPAGSNTVTPLTSATWKGYINTFNISDGAYQFGFEYGVADMQSTITDTYVKLQPNFGIWTAEASNAAWFDSSSGTQTPILNIEGNTFVENNDLAGSDLTFEGNVSAADLDAGYTAVAFIKALDPNNGYATVVNKSIDITSAGDFTVSATAAELVEGFIVQYGFAVTGPPADPATEDSLGSVVMGDESTAGIDDQDLITLNMFPNPASDVLNISAQNTINTVEIYNVLGQKVIRMNVEDTSAEINVSNLNAGIYLIKYEINNRTSTKKFVKN